MTNIVIIGNGIAGVTAARHIRKISSDAQITIISSESKYFFSRTALMYVFMGHMKFEHTQPYEEFFWGKNRINLIQDHVEKINPEDSSLNLKTGEILKYDKLIIATGSKYNKFDLPNSDLKGVQGMYSKQDLEELFENTQDCKSAAVIGGGLIGVELAEMLISRGIETHFVVREKTFWSGVLPEAEGKMIMEHFKKHHHLHMHYEEELAEIKGDNRVTSVITKKGTEINCSVVGLSIGVSANKKLAEECGIECDKGILVNEYLETNLPNIFAVGDCVQLKDAKDGRRTIEQVWYAGRMMGEAIAPTVLGNKKEYNPGPWFNSAKFFDIEYQTYGIVKPKLEDNEAEFVWQHPTEEILLHFVFDKENKTFIGINNFGLRLRHDLMDKWLRDKQTIQIILENFETVCFDPEFHRAYGKDILNAYNEKYNTNYQMNKKVWWRNLLEKNTRPVHG